MKYSTLFFALLFLNSCGDNALSGSDHLVFGSFAGECIGEGCVELFKIDNNKLYEDQVDDYFGTTYDWAELSNDKYELVKDLLNFLPDEFESLPDSTFGCPDCYDQGGYHIQLNKSGDIKTWRIDSNRDDVPDYLDEFLDKASEKIQLLRS